MRPREQALGRSRDEGAASRSRRTGRLVLDRHPRRLPLHDCESTHGLVLQDPARRAPGESIDSLCARQGARRLLDHQRHDLHARPERGLRLLGIARQRGMVMGRCAAAVQKGGGLSAWRRRHARRRRRASRGRVAAALGDSRGLARRGRRMRHSEDSRIQPRRQCRQRVLSDEPETRRALARHKGLSPARPVASEPHGDDARARRARQDRRRHGAAARRRDRVLAPYARDGASLRRLPRSFWRRAASDRRNCCSSPVSDPPPSSQSAA